MEIKANVSATQRQLLKTILKCHVIDNFILVFGVW